MRTVCQGDYHSKCRDCFDDRKARRQAQVAITEAAVRDLEEKSVSTASEEESDSGTTSSGGEVPINPLKVRRREGEKRGSDGRVTPEEHAFGRGSSGSAGGPVNDLLDGTCVGPCSQTAVSGGPCPEKCHRSAGHEGDCNCGLELLHTE